MLSITTTELLVNKEKFDNSTCQQHFADFHKTFFNKKKIGFLHKSPQTFFSMKPKICISPPG